MATKYVGKEGIRLQKAEWLKCQADDCYRIIKRFDNGSVKVELRWSGEIKEPLASQHEEYWPVFILLVSNYLDDGTSRHDPVDNGLTFPTEAAAIEGYEAFLLKHGKCTLEDGEFTEVENRLTPPPPPDKNKPETQSELLGSEGAW